MPKKLAKNPDAEVKIRPYTGKPTFFEQIGHQPVHGDAGFLIASVMPFHWGSSAA